MFIIFDSLILFILLVKTSGVAQDACKTFVIKHATSCSCKYYVEIDSYTVRCYDKFLNYKNLLSNYEKPVKFLNTYYDVSDINISSLAGLTVELSLFDSNLIKFNYSYHLIFSNIVAIEDEAFKVIISIKLK